MRGTLLHALPRLEFRGIIPAYAGNTSMPSALPPAPRDHPRVCGEHPITDNVPKTALGSSPRMRGTPSLHEILGGELGIIPAYAGNTGSPTCPDGSAGDHPRVCGEHAYQDMSSGGVKGSSPRMRGTPQAVSGIRVV